MLATNALFAFHFILFDLSVLCAALGQDNNEDDDDLSLKIRRISSGIVRGRQIPISYAGGGNAFLFAAVPYARAPSANLRFQPPQPPEPWGGVRDATERGPSCWWNTS
uniref:Carboxylesterase type B domain-containing protein n=1 Tax=Globodera rostochiensis TaxID=31243 RepID=A0A914GY01_GLORO